MKIISDGVNYLWGTKEMLLQYGWHCNTLCSGDISQNVDRNASIRVSE